MKRVLTYGTFDLTHIGHIRILERASKLWDYLIVWISTDEFNASKWKENHFSYEERKEIVGSIKYVDQVIPESSWKQKWDDIKNYDIDVFVMWDDWKWKFNELDTICEVVYLPRTPDISSTKIKKDIAWKA